MPTGSEKQPDRDNQTTPGAKHPDNTELLQPVPWYAAGKPKRNKVKPQQFALDMHEGPEQYSLF